MSASSVLSYARFILAHVPWTHWMVMGVVSSALIVILLICKKCSVYGVISLGLTVFMGLFVLDTAVVIRYLGITPHSSGYNLTPDFFRLFQKNGQGPAETISNIVVFVPFGFFLSEFLNEFRSGSLSEIKQFGVWQQVGMVALAAFGLSLCIECIQLLLHVGFFELTDLVMNSIGGLIGVSLTVLWRGRTLSKGKK